MDIYKGWVNVNKLMNCLLYKIGEFYGFCIVFIDGGSFCNVIFWEFVVIVVVFNGYLIVFLEVFEVCCWEMLCEFVSIEFGMMIEQVEIIIFEKVMWLEDQEKVFVVFYVVFNGVWCMSFDIFNLVEIFSSLVWVIVKNGSFVMQSLQCSFIELGKYDVVVVVCVVFEVVGVIVVNDGDYFGWAFDVDFKIMCMMEGLYKDFFDDVFKVFVCYVGLECGIFSQYMLELDMIFFGLIIYYVYLFDEQVNIVLVQKFWWYLVGVLEWI